MKVYLATPRGFCAGVVRAIEIVESALKKYGPPIYVKHQIVHNDVAVNDLERKGAITVDRVGDVPLGARVVFSAHGSPPSDYAIARSRKLQVVDATCPLVTKVHNEARKYTREGRRTILIGHTGHQEVVGTMGYAKMSLYDETSNIVPDEIEHDAPVAVLTQTTLSVDDTSAAVAKLRAKYSDIVVRNDICYATTNRQVAIRELCSHVGHVLVIGSQHSSNCKRLVELACGEGVQTQLINGPEELDAQFLQGVDVVGITSGASTPEKVVAKVVAKLNPDEIIEVGKGAENIYFNLPDELKPGQ